MFSRKFSSYFIATEDGLLHRNVGRSKEIDSVENQTKGESSLTDCMFSGALVGEVESGGRPASQSALGCNSLLK